MKKFKVNELARLAGVTPQTLRRYDELGIFRPERIERNSYRLYETKNLVQLLRLQSLKHQGFSLREVRDIYEADLDRTVAAYEKHIHALEKKLEELEREKRLALEHQRRLEDWKRLRAVPFELRERPECQVFLYWQGDEVPDEDWVAEQLPFVAGFVGPMRSCVVRRLEDVLEEDLRSYGGVYAYTEELPESWWSRDVKHVTLPACTCMVVAGGGAHTEDGAAAQPGQLNNRRNLARVKELARENHFRICGDILGEVLHMQRARRTDIPYNDNYHSYSITWIPVEPMSD